MFRQICATVVNDGVAKLRSDSSGDLEYWVCVMVRDWMLRLHWFGS